MADASPGSNAPPAGAPPAGAPPAGSPAAASKPDYVPDSFWNTQKGEVDVQGLATKYTELSTRFAKGKEALVPEIKAEVHKELFGKRPEKPDLYKFDLPKQGPLLDRLAKNKLVMLPETPGQDFKPEPGKNYYVFNQQGKLFQLGKQLAHKAGMSNDEFMDLAATFAEIELEKRAEETKTTAAKLAENRKLLGENADKRVDYVKGKINAIAGDKAAEALDLDYLPSSAIEVIEKLLEKGGEPRFSSGPAQPAPNTQALEEEKQALMKSPDYWESPGKQKRVQEIYRQLMGGKPARLAQERKRA